ncbi:MAG: hypothetical protein BGO59_16805 [Spirosoma sp. 48-14]|nr:MAG: hypothetical protein BGO59_16805 [Spirosoma sp. 48-14]
MPITVKTRKAIMERSTQQLRKMGGWKRKTGFIGLLNIDWLWKSKSKQIVLISYTYSAMPYQLAQEINCNDGGLLTKPLSQKRKPDDTRSPGF